MTKITKFCKIRIRNVPYIGIKTNDSGEFLVKKNKKYNEFFDIKLSNRKNKKSPEYLSTLLHELFHLGLHVFCNVYHVKLSDKSEHDFINRIEESVKVYFHLLKFKNK